MVDEQPNEQPDEESQQQTPRQGLKRWWHNLDDVTKLLTGLAALQTLDCSGCRLTSTSQDVLRKPSLQWLVLYKPAFPG